MKLIFAIVNNDDSAAVSSSLTHEGFQVTKIASTGGFLMAGNTTFITGVDDGKVNDVIDIIRKHSKKHQQTVPNTIAGGGAYASPTPMQVTVGGSTILVLNVERFEKV